MKNIYKKTPQTVVYISGAITGHSPREYLTKFAEAEKQLTARGYVVVNPAKINDLLPHAANGEFAFTHEGYMNVSYALLELCDYIYVIDGETTSKGVKLELEYAENYGIPRLYLV